MKGKINFHLEDIKFNLKNKTGLKAWIKACVENENHKLQELNIIFCSDERLLEINVEFLDHDYYTDIITFDNSETPGTIEGDLFISIDRVRDNAETLKSDFTRDLHRVIIHGVLHLLGYLDKSEKDEALMRLKEDQYLGQYTLIAGKQAGSSENPQP